MVKLHFARRGEVWHVDFRVGGVRYRMTTGETDRDAAEEVGRARLDNVLAMLSGRKDQTTLGEALDHYVEYLGPRYTLPVFPRLKRRGPIEADRLPIVVPEGYLFSTSKKTCLLCRFSLGGILLVIPY